MRGDMSGQTMLSGVTTPDEGITSPERDTKTQRAPSLIRCNGCDNGWTGAMVCHCCVCHRTFTGFRAFDTHRVGAVCNDPETILTKTGEPRLVRVEKTHWSGWGQPGERPVPE